MNDYIIETHNLTKKYGSQTSVSHLNIHVKKGRIYGYWDATVQVRPRPCGCC